MEQDGERSTTQGDGQPDDDGLDESMGPEDFEGDIVALADYAVDRRLRHAVASGSFGGTDESRTAALDSVMDVATDAVADELVSAGRQFAAEITEHQAGFNERLRGFYGTGLDGMRSFVQTCMQAAWGMNQRGTIDVTTHALLDLHARACLAGLEVHVLLTSGYPMGALASWRTVHELAVVAILLRQHGRKDHHRLTERWMAYADVQRYSDALVYQKRAAVLGYEPFPDDTMAGWFEQRENAVKTYGKGFKEPNAWAAEITGKTRPSFADLERLAGLDHLRGHYRWANHHVHADPRGSTLNLIEYRDQRLRLAGPMNVLLVDPADLTMGSLVMVTQALLMAGYAEAPTPGVAVVMESLSRYRQQVRDDLSAGEQAVHEAEQRIRTQDQGDPTSG